MRFNPLDESMDMVGRDCPWILTIFLPSQLAQIVIWLITAMVYNSDLAFLSGSDEDWKTFARKSHYFSCRLYAKGFERQDQGMQKNEVFVKGNILGLLNERRMNLMDFYVLPLTILGSLGAILLIEQNKIGQEGFLFLFWYVVAIYYSFYAIVMFWKEPGFPGFGTHYTGCYSLVYCLSPLLYSNTYHPRCLEGFPLLFAIIASISYHDGIDFIVYLLLGRMI